MGTAGRKIISASGGAGRADRRDAARLQAQMEDRAGRLLSDADALEYCGWDDDARELRLEARNLDRARARVR